MFDEELRAQLLRRVEVTAGLEAALLADEELELVYQPVVSLRDGGIIAAEALVRWRHPRLGIIGPDEFIPIAEETGLIVPLGRYMLTRGAAQAARWRAELPGLLPNGVGVNVSARELAEPGFAEEFAETLARNGLGSGDMALELTERAFIDDRDAAVAENLAALTRQGVRLVLDDFGSGYSALASLKRFPLAAVKIDKFFVDAIKSPGDEAPVIRAVLGLGRALDLTVTAEGIETQVQLDFVRAAGCDNAQGFLLGRPLAAVEFSTLLRTGVHEALKPRRAPASATQRRLVAAVPPQLELQLEPELGAA